MQFSPDSPDLLRTFIAETEDLLDSLTFDAARNTRDPDELAKRARRTVHTIKGNAAMLGLDDVVDASHQAEQRLSDESPGQHVLEAIDQIGPHLARLRNLLGVRPKPKRADNRPDHPGANQIEERQMVRVDHQRLLEVEQLVRSVAAAASIVRDTAGDTSAELTEATNTLSQRISRLEGAVSRARLQRFDSLFGRAARLVRELSNSTGHEAVLTASGGQAEVDRAVLDLLHPAIVQLVRNSFAHGFETSEVREQRGKPAQCRIHINTKIDGDTLRVVYADDGAGIDRAKLRARAAGMFNDPQIELLDDEATDRLILRSGLSTSPTAGSLAGRGVGMEVVLAQLERLGGRIDLENRPGVGLIVRMTVPLVAPPASE